MTPGQIIDRDRRARRARTIRALALSALVLLGAGVAYSQRATLEPMIVNYWQYKRFAHPRDELVAAARGTTFQDCRAGSPLCPVMVVVPEGQFLMGAAPNDPDGNGHPQRRISVGRLAVSRTEVTFNEWAVCVAAGHCPEYPYQDEGMGFGERPSETSHGTMRRPMPPGSRKRLGRPIAS